jgi:hypothetical protein
LIKFFKINDPYRLIVLVVFFLGVRAVLFFFELPFTFPELKFFLVARAMEDGKWLYRDVWETVEPFTTFVYYLLPTCQQSFSNVAYWINVTLLLFNALYINWQFHRFDVLSDKTHLPAFFYLFLSLCFIELNTLSAMLLASTFLLFVASNFLSYLKNEESRRMYDAGFFLGVSSLFQLSVSVFLLFLIISLVVFTRSSGRSYFLLLLGTVFPWFIVASYFLWFDSFSEFFHVFLLNYFKSTHNYVFWSELGYVLLIPGLIFLLALFLSLRGGIREINYQNIGRKFLFLWLIGSLTTIVVSPISSLALLHLLIMPLCFFYTFYFIQLKKTRVANMLLLTAIMGMILVQARTAMGLAWRGSSRKLVVKAKKNALLENKRLFVAGDSSIYYLNAKIATKYLNWDVSHKDFGNIDEFSSIESIKNSLDKDLPEVIVDHQHIMSKVFKRVPSLKEKYLLYESGIYVLQRK